MVEVIKKPLSEVKSKLNEFVRLVELEGVEVVLLKYGRECARLVPVVAPSGPPRLRGFGKDLVSYEDHSSAALLNPDENAWGDIEVDGEKIKLK